MQKNLIILLSLLFSLLNTGYGLYSIFDEIPCTVPVLYAGDTIRVFNLNEYRRTDLLTKEDKGFDNSFEGGLSNENNLGTLNIW